MLNGDLSNQAAPRIYVVFDKLIGKLPEDSGNFYELIDDKKYKDALDLMIIDHLMFNRLAYLCNKKNINVYLVTWMGHGMAEAVEDFMSGMGILVRGCIASAPVSLAKLIIQDETVIGVYDPDPDHSLTYGTKGRVVKSERDLT